MSVACFASSSAGERPAAGNKVVWCVGGGIEEERKRRREVRRKTRPFWNNAAFAAEFVLLSKWLTLDFFVAGLLIDAKRFSKGKKGCASFCSPSKFTPTTPNLDPQRPIASQDRFS